MPYPKYDIIGKFELWRAFGGLCALCALALDPEQVLFGHVVSVRDGGQHTRGNIAPVHPACEIEWNRQEVGEEVLDAAGLALAGDKVLKRLIRSWDASEISARAARLREVNGILAKGADKGFAHSGGPEAAWTLGEAKDAYIYGFYVSSIFCSHAACERHLAGMHSFYEDSPEASRWGLGRLVTWAEGHGLPADLAARLRQLTEKRKYLGHFKRPFADNADLLSRLRQMESGEDWAEDLAALLRADALESLELAFDLYVRVSGIP